MISFDDFDETNSPRPNDNDFSKILDRAVSRRGFLKTGAAFGVSAFVTGGAATTAMAESATAMSKAMGFAAVAANSDDTITVPAGYTWQNVISWGDPLFSDGVPFDHKTRGTGASQERAFGDNNDGMSFFPLSDTASACLTSSVSTANGFRK